MTCKVPSSAEVLIAPGHEALAMKHSVCTGTWTRR